MSDGRAVQDLTLDYFSSKKSGKRREIGKEDLKGGTRKVGGKTGELGVLEARRESIQGGRDELGSAADGGQVRGALRPLGFSARRPLVTLTGAVPEGW